MDPEFSIKVKLEEILQETGYAESRSNKLDQDDFLKYAPFPLYLHLILFKMTFLSLDC